MIVKYKLVDGKIPTNIVDGGYFSNGEYLIGKGVVLQQDILTSAELLTQVLSQHSTTPFKVMEEMEERDMTVEEVTAMVNNWCNERGE